MAFETYDADQQSALRGVSLIHLIRTIYQHSKSVQAIMADYAAETNPVLNGVVDLLSNPAARVEFADMLDGIDTLVAAWEASHTDLLDITP